MTTDGATTRTSRPEHVAAEEVALLHQYWAAASYLTAAQIYFLDNPLPREPLQRIKPRLLGHWGTVAFEVDGYDVKGGTRLGAW
jgi:xylulose-5-phosphate/fructose-6-phosphate phosphoketolase